MIKPDLHLKMESEVDQSGSSGGGGKERFKKAGEEMEDFRKEDKSEPSTQGSFGSESVPDSPASQISQR